LLGSGFRRSAWIDGQMIRTVNLRDEHAALGVGRDFPTWVKDRIAKYAFVEGEDYVVTLVSGVPKSGERRIWYFRRYIIRLDASKAPKSPVIAGAAKSLV
jgi:phage anti-repressor protein